MGMPEHSDQATVPWVTLNQRLETLRFAQVGNPYVGRFKPGKGIVDAAGVNNFNLQSPHRPNLECTEPWTHHMEALFVVYHYAGSWERYSFRNDSRKTVEEWYRRGNITSQAPLLDSCYHEIHQWVPRFLQQVGHEKGMKLLLG